MSLAELKQLSEDMKKGFEDFKKIHTEQIEASKKGVTTYIDEKLEKCNASITEADKKFQKLMDEMAKAKELPKGGKAEETKELERKAFRELLRYNRIVTPELANHAKMVVAEDPATGTVQTKAFALSSDPAAGYLAPLEYRNEIIKGVVEYSPIRDLAQIDRTSRSAIQTPAKTGAITASWAGEISTRAENTGMTYGLKTIPVHEMTALIISSQWQLEDSAFDIEALIRQECVEQFGVAEGKAFVSGTGIQQPEGILNAGLPAALTIGSVTGTDTSTHLVASNDLIDLQFKVKEFYQANSSFLLRWETIGKVRKLKDATSGQYLWAPLSQGSPPTILGRPYRACIDLDLDGTASKNVALFGDFRKGYRIVDRVDMTILRDPYTKASTGQIAFWVRARVGGQVVLAEAIARLITG